MDMRHVLRPLALVTAASLALAFIALIGERRINAVPPPQTLLPTYAAHWPMPKNSTSPMAWACRARAR